MLLLAVYLFVQTDGAGAARPSSVETWPTTVEHVPADGTAEERYLVHRAQVLARAEARAAHMAALADGRATAGADVDADAGADVHADVDAADAATGAEPAADGSEVAASGTAGAMGAAATPVRGAGAPLSWTAPAGHAGFPVTRVETVDAVTTVNGRGGDVLVQLSTAHPVGPVIIANCRNAVVIGGQIDVLPTARIGGDDQRGIYVHKCTGTVHIEGVLINGAVGGSQSDGIAVNAPEAIVQIQNVRVEGLRGTYDVNHADVFQPWGGVREFRIDRLTGSTNYQGIQVRQDLGRIGRGTIRNANVASSGITPIDRGGHYMRVDCDAYPLTLDNVYVAGRPERSFGTTLWPQSDDARCPAVVTAGVASWPSSAAVTGGVREGRPTSGDFVPAGSVGLGYVSPGYR